jgi:hypothetical protein
VKDTSVEDLTKFMVTEYRRELAAGQHLLDQ